MEVTVFSAYIRHFTIIVTQVGITVFLSERKLRLWGLLSRHSMGRLMQTISLCKGPTTAGRCLTVNTVGHVGIIGKNRLGSVDGK